MRTESRTISSFCSECVLACWLELSVGFDVAVVKDYFWLIITFRIIFWLWWTNLFLCGSRCNCDPNAVRAGWRCMIVEHWLHNRHRLFVVCPFRIIGRDGLPIESRYECKALNRTMRGHVIGGERAFHRQGRRCVSGRCVSGRWVFAVRCIHSRCMHDHDGGF
jgi:hypothetical protein